MFIIDDFGEFLNPPLEIFYKLEGNFIMRIGIICEYNPLHLGHKKQMERIRAEFGPETAIVCAMSGNFVQRGHPAILDKSIRAQAALQSGADLVLELPVTVSLASAEGFAAGGVGILSRMCDRLCFGAETAQPHALMETAQALLNDGFPPLLRQQLETGKSFPAARQEALTQMGVDAFLLDRPNDILAVEYCKAILSQQVSMEPFPIRRDGSYHAQEADSENPSATALRALMSQGQNWQSFVPEEARTCLAGGSLHTLAAGERSVLQKLRTMTDEDFAALPYGSEGLWRKLMHESRRQPTLEAILTAVKSKRYTRTRLDRMVMCAFLGISQQMLEAEAPYTRVLGFTNRGREILRDVKKEFPFLNPGEKSDHPYWQLEKRCGDLYGLFCVDSPEPPGAEENRRIIYYQRKQ